MSWLKNHIFGVMLFKSFVEESKCQMHPSNLVDQSEVEIYRFNHLLVDQS
ncbi:protein of unknown function [Rhodovastum atsumiense]|nr:protein of unknown function [Rhodovastum atsumiense]